MSIEFFAIEIIKLQVFLSRMLIFLAQQALLLSPPFFFLRAGAFVMLFFTLRQPDFKLDSAAGIMHIDWYKCVAGALDIPNKLIDFLRVQQQFARPDGIRMKVS